jgi:outer membrane receptor protein involved in Fe transport
MSRQSMDNTSRWARKATSRLLSFALLLTALGTGTSVAQVLYGSLTGTVTDPSGAVIVGAKVTALDPQTGVGDVATTDSSGIYRFTTLLAGTFKVTITMAGFETQETLGVEIRVNEIARVNASLKAATTAQEVTVTTEAPLLQTDKADVHIDITSRQIENLPIMGTEGANFQSLLRTIPGAGLSAETNSQAGNPQRAINVNMNGLSNQSSNTRIDGVQDAYPWLPANVAYVPPADAIENVNVVTNSFDAEQGMAGGAAVNVQIKSGTNRFHGEAHEFHTDQSFAARNYFNTDTTNPAFKKKNRNNQNQFGGAVGGPILKDKLFFFADYERTTQRGLAGPDTRTLPTAAMVNGDFRGLVDSQGNPITIYDPATGDVHGANKQQVSCNGVLNTICPGRIDPASAAMIKLLQPLIGQEVATTNNLGNWTGNGTALFNRDNMDAKINYVPTAATMVFGRYSFSKTLVYDPPLLGPAIGDATNGGQLGNAPGLVQSIGLGVTHTFTPSLLVDWNFGFTRQRLGSTFDLSSAKGINDLGIPGSNNAGATGDPSLYYGLPGFIFPTGNLNNPNTTGSIVNPAGAALGNAQPANPFLFRDQQYVTGANVSWNKGKHAFRGGMEWDHSQINHFQPQGGTFQEPRGAFEFNGYVTDLQGTTPTWFHSWADFLLGLPSATGKARALFNPNALRWSVWAWYLQDRYQVTPKLTLSLGVRWEYYPFGYSDNGKGLRVLDLSTGMVNIGGYGSIPRNDGIDTGSGNFLPRVGAAYRFNSSTVLRVGYGMSADPYTWHVLRNAYPSVVLDSNSLGIPTATASDYIPAASLTGLNGTGLGSGSYSVFKGIQLLPLPDLTSGSIKLPTSAGTTTFPKTFNRGYINSYNLAVEQQFGNSLTANIGYVGTYDVRPVINLNANASLPGTGSASANGLLSQAYTQLGLCSPCNYTAGINVLKPYLHSRYDSLQTRLIYRFAGGSNVTASYTWSKTMDYADNEDLGGLAYPYPSPAIIQMNYAPSNFDRTNNLEISGVIAMPFGKGEPWLKSGPGSWILGGWLVNPVISAMSGFPFTVGAGGSLNANGSGQTADLIKPFKKLGGKPPRTGVTCSDPSCEFFDPSSFAAPLIPIVGGQPVNPHYGNTKRNEFRGPNFFNMNLSIVRDFKIWEYATLQIRGDAFGFTNTPHFNNPSASCNANANPASGVEQVCTTGGNFGIVTSVVQPGGFFGPDAGNRVVWLGANVKF